MPRRLSLSLVTCALAMLSCLSFGQSASPVGDVLTYSNNPNTNYGSYTSLFVQKGSVTSSSYLKFNLNTLPAGASVSKATLRLFVDQVAAPGSFDVFQLNSSWNEGSVTYNNAPSLGQSATKLLSMPSTQRSRFAADASACPEARDIEDSRRAIR